MPMELVYVERNESRIVKNNNNNNRNVFFSFRFLLSYDTLTRELSVFSSFSVFLIRLEYSDWKLRAREKDNSSERDEQSIVIASFHITKIELSAIVGSHTHARTHSKIDGICVCARSSVRRYAFIVDK